MVRKSIFNQLFKRLQEKRRFIQVLSGPRQTGKTTLATQVCEKLTYPFHFAAADEPKLQGSAWIEQHWETARALIKTGKAKKALLVLDEVQKISQWSTVVKKLWDQDSQNKTQLQVLILGSSPLLLQSGLTESLAGRFEIIPVPHWSFSEMHETFGWNLDQYLYFGGYPGSANLISNETRWKAYIKDSLIETTVSKDILLLTRVDKPALLRQLFKLGCDYSGKILSYQKMLGQLQDAGNTTTLAHYLDLLRGASLITGLPKFSGKKVRQRASSPKLNVLNTALMTAQSEVSFKDAEQDRNFWGQLFETVVGAHLINGLKETSAQVFYWRESNREVDFVIQSGKKICAIEVKSGRVRDALVGMDLFSQRFKLNKKLLIGKEGIPIEEFLLQPPSVWIED